MCRLALYVGPSRPWGALFTAPHGLDVQAHSPRELQHGTVNVDGTGVAWWPDEDDVPLRYATVAPPWGDPNLASLGPRLPARTVLAAVRGGTPGVGTGIEHVAPFVLGDLAVAHNGWLGGFRDGVAAALLRRLPDDLVTALPAVNDSRLIAVAVAAHRREGASLPEAVAAACADAAAVVTAADRPATLNVFATDGREAVVSRASVALAGNSLYVAERAGAWPGAVVVASEPLDGTGHPDWRPVPDDTLLHVVDGHVTTHDLDLTDVRTTDEEEPA